MNAQKCYCTLIKCKKTLLNLIYTQISYFRANECLYLRDYAIFCLN